MDQKLIAYLGPTGTNTEQACLLYDETAKLIPCLSIPEVFGKVNAGDAHKGIVPIENSVAGPVSLTLDLLIHESQLYIRNEVVLPITHSLIVSEPVDLSEIKLIYSHPQAIEQCRTYLAENCPNAQIVASMSTSSAVGQVMSDRFGSAAIATQRASELHGALVLVEGIEDYKNNMTRFVVLDSHDDVPTGNDKTSICFSFDGDSPGILHSVLAEFANHHINLAKIESRPTRESLGSYIFLVDLEGHRVDTVVSQALEAIEKIVSMLKVFGSYPKHEFKKNQ